MVFESDVMWGATPLRFFRVRALTLDDHYRQRFRYNQPMTQEAADLLKRALSLPVSERADLASSLIESLDETQDPGVAAAWDEEVARRMADIDSGKVLPVSLEEARHRLSSALK
jgi:putative addiction module component (TIGR02574 family)